MYHYQGCGLPNVWLVNGYTEKEAPYGEAVSIEDIDGLHKAIGRELSQKPGKFTGDEVKFLRKEMDMSQRALADGLEVQEITVRKWEQKGLSGPAQRLMRILYLEYINEGSQIRSLIERLNQLDSTLQTIELRFKDAPDGGWYRDRAA